MATESIIRTNLIPPAFVSDILSRPHSIERIENGRYLKLKFLTTPTGYGKTVLVS